MMSERPWPTQLKFKAQKRILDLSFDTDECFEIPYELLRVESPSAEVQGHHPSQKRRVTGKADIGIDKAELVGRYAIRLIFSDGHSSGIYSWDYLYELGCEANERLAAYHAQNPR